jgi:hypothetical protein
MRQAERQFLGLSSQEPPRSSLGSSSLALGVSQALPSLGAPS